MKVFLDTNVVVSAFATRGLCADLLTVVLAEHELVLGETVLEEVRRVLREKLRMPRGTVEQVEAFLRRQATVSTPEATPRLAGLDAADAQVVAEAVAGQVDVLVTGDQDLLELREPPIKIVSPRGLWDRLRRAT
ncbi:MAG TPA: putative toxin-antitoxin system toxin component, PIN family [Gemmatimonadales bacterium]|nr:putative toxin-antitoxin system toxin component, PIN family [Gemmatimonadales bacterium]